MAKIDAPSKRLIQLRPKDWVRFALNTSEDLILEEIKPDKNPKVESRLDALFWIKYDKEKFVLNIEPQGYYDLSLPARMLRYRADIWEYTMKKTKEIPSIKQVVILYYPKNDSKIHELKDERQNSKLHYSYDVIRVWEVKKDHVINNRLIGLYPLLPLMEKESGETDETIIEKTVNAIETIKDESLKSDALAAMSIMSVDKYSKSLIQKYVRREMLMNSPLFEEWVREEREETAEKVTKDIITFQLESKFDFAPSHIIKEIEAISDMAILKGILKKIITIASIEELEDFLTKAKALSKL